MFPNMNPVLKIVYPRGQVFPSSAGWAPRLWSVVITELEISPRICTTFVIGSDTCEGSQTGNIQLPVIRTLYPITSGNKHIFTFTVLYTILRYT